MIVLHGTKNQFRLDRTHDILHFCPSTDRKRFTAWKVEGYRCFMCKETLPLMYQLAHKLGVPFEYNV